MRISPYKNNMIIFASDRTLSFIQINNKSESSFNRSTMILRLILKNFLSFDDEAQFDMFPNYFFLR